MWAKRSRSDSGDAKQQGSPPQPKWRQGSSGDWWVQASGGKWVTQKQWEEQMPAKGEAAAPTSTDTKISDTGGSAAGSTRAAGSEGSAATSASAARGPTSSQNPLAPLFVLTAASVAEFIAGIVVCADEDIETTEFGSGNAYETAYLQLAGYCDGYEAYSVAVGTLSMMLCAPQLLTELASALAPRLSELIATAKLGELPLTSAIAFFLILWWGNATLLLTFIKPFTSLSNGLASCWVALLAAVMLAFENSPRFRQLLSRTVFTPARSAGTRHRTVITLLGVSSTAVWISAAVAMGRYEDERKTGFRAWAVSTGLISMCMAIAYLRFVPIELPAAPRRLYAFSLMCGACWGIMGVSFSFVPVLFAGSAVGILSTWLSVALTAHLLVLEPHTRQFWRRTGECFRWAFDTEPSMPREESVPASVSADGEREEREEMERAFPDPALKSAPDRITRASSRSTGFTQAAQLASGESRAGEAGATDATGTPSATLGQSALEQLAARITNECPEVKQAVAMAILTTLLGEEPSIQLNGEEGATFLTCLQTLLPLVTSALPPASASEQTVEHDSGALVASGTEMTSPEAGRSSQEALGTLEV